MTDPAARRARVEEYTLCDRTLMPAKDGVCVSHGGDACLRQFVPKGAYDDAVQAQVDVAADAIKRLREREDELGRYMMMNNGLSERLAALDAQRAEMERKYAHEIEMRQKMIKYARDAESAALAERDRLAAALDHIKRNITSPAASAVVDDALKLLAPSPRATEETTGE